jgi:hypothetical protein
LGSQPRQGFARLRAKREAQESHFVLLGVKNNVREWTFTLPSELPFWELESQWTPKHLEGDCRGQNLSVWKVLYTIEKILKRRYLKWAHMMHLDIWNTSYGQKKGRESNWQFDSRPLKVGNRPNFLACICRATYCWKALNQGYNFVWDLIVIEGLHTKLWGPKVARVPTLGISGLPFGTRQNAIWMWPPKKGAEYTIREKVVASPKSGPWWVLWIRVCPWFILTPKRWNYALIKLFILCKSVWMIKRLSFFLVPSRNSNMPFYPFKVMWAKERASTPYSSFVFTLNSHLSLSKSLGVRHKDLENLRLEETSERPHLKDDTAFA